MNGRDKQNEERASTPKVAYIWSTQYEQVCDNLPSNIGRSSRVHSLIRAYGLDKLMTIAEPEKASIDDLCTFHEQEYIEFLLSRPTDSSPSKKRKRSGSTSSSSSTSTTSDPHSTFGLEYDCPPFSSLPEYVTLLGGAALESARLLSSHDVVIHWDGGRHHALRSRAVGYCYLADIPLSILSLLRKFKRVLYVDLDAHHGDGVEFAFNRTEKVVTLSFHVYEPGFFPGTGSGEEGGKKVYNIPLERGMKGVVWEEVVKRGVEMVVEKYDPECFVVQCGCDGTLFLFDEADEGLVTDPHRALQLTTYSFQRVMSFILTLRGERPVLLVGGGGYHAPSTAKHFTLLTALVLGQTLSDDIPLEAEYWEELERDGGIHVGRDTHELESKGKEEVDRLCTALSQKLDKTVLN